MIASERKKYILGKLNANGIVNVRETAQELNLHETTIRRDLEKLEKEGRLTRIYGGATLNDDSVELTMTQKLFLNFEAKKEVCRCACELVHDGDCIFIDGGTTTYSMIDFLASKKIQIVTHSDLIIRRIKKCEAQIITIGGKYLPHYNMSVGINAQDLISYTSEAETLDVKRTAMENSDHAYLLIDASKWNVKGFCKFAHLDEFDKVFCNAFDDYDGRIANLELVK